MSDNGLAGGTRLSLTDWRDRTGAAPAQIKRQAVVVLHDDLAFCCHRRNDRIVARDSQTGAVRPAVSARDSGQRCSTGLTPLGLIAARPVSIRSAAGTG